MLSPPVIRDWARRLIDSELDADPSSKQPELATLRVYEKLRRQLCAPVGVDAFQALASRALSLAKSRYPQLSMVHVTASGGLRGLNEIEFPLNTEEDDKVGIILITELLGLVLTLLGEAATVRLIEGMPLQSEVKVKMDTPAMSQLAAGTSYLGPFEDILLEADQLRNVSERLDSLADKHCGIEQLQSVAVSIRSIAAVLDVFTLIRSKAGTSEKDAPDPSTQGYIN
jgi:hypothetical protein